MFSFYGPVFFMQILSVYLAEDKCEGTEELDILPVSLVGPEAANTLHRCTQTLC